MAGVFFANYMFIKGDDLNHVTSIRNGSNVQYAFWIETNS
jgi:hypothetical protein